MTVGPAPLGNGASGESADRILLLVDHDQNRRLLANWLAPTYSVLTPDPDGEPLANDFDLCLVDESSFSRHVDALQERKASASPRFLPYLLVTQAPSPARNPEMWEYVDEVITSPVEKAILRARIDGLLERRRLSLELYREKEQSEERFRTLFDTAPDPVFVFDADGRIRSVNDAFRRLTGVDDVDIHGRPISEVEVFSESAVKALTADLHARTDAEAAVDETYTVTYTTQDGETRHAEVNTASVPGDGATEIVGVLRDVTERKEREDELERKNERLDEFASMLAHELRNPLGIAQVYLGMAEEGDDDSFGQINDALQRMDRMIDRLLGLARRGETVGESESVELSSVAADAWSQVVAPEATLTIESDATVRADPERLLEVFENLFQNAVEHGGDDVSVRVRTDDDSIYVEDDGPGIPEEKRAAIFERGYSAAESGVGLGLTIVKRVVEAHGWEVAVPEADGVGARFEISNVEFE
ncbi:MULTISPECIES: two-component system sensor histidine kinase NtrB [Halorussus]|uniref:two-component system sensor histidine kinase NtrB n=1 Tax=Halorussus TaxID=1070314 RepID=UPI0020A1B778|nr:PAS domain-containing sensor histidine kinase [Halorussus vallis]USZ78271.1 PAS domain-containing sensor histidine kinase [Halorussus vallis]